MSIGQAAGASGVSAKMIRYYEQTGLVPPAERLESGYRVYTDADVHRLRFIRRARDLGFSLAEIDDLLNLWHDTSRRSADVKRIASSHIASLRERIDTLNQMVATLQHLVDCCAGDHRPECPILSDLEDPHDDLPVAPARQNPSRRNSRG